MLFTGLAKFDGNRQRVLRTREFQQIAGRAGRAGYDTAGYVVVQAPEHVIDNERAKKKAEAKNAAPGANAKRKSKAQLKKPPEGTVVWTEQTYDKLVAGVPEQLTSRMRVDNAMLINVATREEDAFAVMRRLLTDNHEDRRQQLRLARRALRLARSLLRTGVLTRLDEVDEFGRRYVLTVDLPADFALNQPLAHFALAALDVLDPESDTYTLDIVSVVESVLEAPRQILMAQQFTARGEAVSEMKADGLEYDERMALLDEITWPQPLAELLGALYETYRERHPWLREDALGPKAVVRELWEQGMGFTDFVGRYQLARSEGLVLRYLTDAYRTLRQTVPDAHRTPELEDLVEWLGETIRQTDSSLLDEWEALTDPAHVPGRIVAHEPPPPPRPVSKQLRPFTVMIRNAMWARVDLVSRDDLDGLVRLERAAADRLDPPRQVVVGPLGVGRRDRGLLRRPRLGGRRRRRPGTRPGRHRTGAHGRARGRRGGDHGPAARRTPDDPRPRRRPRLGDRRGGGLRRLGRGGRARARHRGDAPALTAYPQPRTAATAARTTSSSGCDTSTTVPGSSAPSGSRVSSWDCRSEAGMKCSRDSIRSRSTSNGAARWTKDTEPSGTPRAARRGRRA